MLQIFNGLIVLVFGIAIMYILLDIEKNKKNLCIVSIFTVVLYNIQGIFYLTFGIDLIITGYPFITHIPTFIFFIILSKQKVTHVLFTLFTAYVLMTPRRLGVEFITHIFKDTIFITIFAEIGVSIVIIVLVYQYLGKVFIKLNRQDTKGNFLINVVPCLYYLVCYIGSIYTDYIYTIDSTIIYQWLASLLSIIFYLMLIYYFQETFDHLIIKQEKEILNIQMKAQQKYIKEIRESQAKVAMYRHDLRHHLQYINMCIGQGDIEKAQDYISEISSEIISSAVVRYCENETVNIILSSYVAKANEKQIVMKVDVKLPKELNISDTDISTILSNSLENAIHAVESIKELEKRKIEITSYIRQDKLLIEVINNYEEKVEFQGGYPMTTKEGHGYGTKSIISIVERYEGISSFTAKEGEFSLRIAI